MDLDKFYDYDIETFPNIFTMGVFQPSLNKRWMFEISERRNDSHHLIDFLRSLFLCKARMVGFNNVGFDYPVLHLLLNEYQTIEPNDISWLLWQKAGEIIDTPWKDRFSNQIRKPYIQQVDLFLIHHFDNSQRATSLKMLEFNMRRKTIQELPFKPNTELTFSQMDTLREYNWVDVDATNEFLNETLDMIAFRDELSAEHRRNFTNFNDTKIGKQIFIIQIEKQKPGTCYNPDGSPRQTWHNSISLSEVVFPYIKFEHPEFQRIRDWYVNQIVSKLEKIEIQGEVNGLIFKLGKGGLHASINDSIIVATPDDAILDIDVKGYYPSMAIKNQLFPEHLGSIWSDVYEDIVDERARHEKGSIKNKALKLAANGSYGDTGSDYSPFYDLKCLLSITINGQLLLCMLAEQLMKIPNLLMIQANTDGLTFRVPRNQLSDVKVVTDWWQEYTCHTLEEEEYCRMFIRDVNNYVGEFMDGSLKLKGDYQYEHPKKRNPTGWHQDLSMMVVPKAAEAALTRGVNIRQFITNHDDIMDFMLRTKAPKKSYIELRMDGWDTKTLQNITRYLVTHRGGYLYKISPPIQGAKEGQWKRANSIPDYLYDEVMLEILKQGDPKLWDTTDRPWDARINTKNQSTYKIRQTAIVSGWQVTPHNNIDSEIDRSTINYEFYIQETEKLVNQLKVIL